jgi:hypothetical protein
MIAAAPLALLALFFFGFLRQAGTGTADAPHAAPLPA